MNAILSIHAHKHTHIHIKGGGKTVRGSQMFVTIGAMLTVTQGVLGACSPRKFRFSESASGAL